MNILNFLDSPFFDFPIKTNKYFPNHLSESFDEYIYLLVSLSEEEKSIVKYIPEIKEICSQIENITAKYFEGKLSASYNLFANLIEHLKKFLTQDGGNATFKRKDEKLFKARSVFDKNYQLIDMFHVPFQHRYNIKTNRFSITGLPCLYLSNSIYTCWEELDRPVFSQMAVSRYETKKKLKYIDLTIHLWSLKRGFSPADDNDYQYREARNLLLTSTKFVLRDFIHLYPLYIACYTSVSNKTADFKPEYIFPQMLMQWIANSGEVDGIIYQSTKAYQAHTILPYNRPGFLNFAIPVKSSKETGFCEDISQLFGLTYPMSWEIINLANPTFTLQANEKKRISERMDASRPMLALDFGKKNLIDYHDTAFGKFEGYLFDTPVQNIF